MIQFSEAHCATAEAGCDLCGVVEGAIGDTDIGDSVAGERPHHALTHLTSAHHEDAATLEGTELGGGHGHRSGGDRCDVAADLGLGADTFAHLERVAEQQVELRTGGLLSLGLLPGMPDLTEDLGLADDCGVHTGGDTEQMLDGLRTVIHIEVIGDLLRRGEGEISEEGAQIRVGRMELLSHHVDLGAIAGGQHHCFADVLVRNHIVQCLRQSGIVDGDALKQRQRNSSVVQPENDYRHVWVGSFDPARGCSRKTPSFPETEQSCQSKRRVRTDVV